MTGFGTGSVCVRKCTKKVQKGLERPEKVKPASAGCFLGIIVSSPSRSLLFKPRQKSFSLASQTTPPLWLVTFLVTSFGDILILVRLLTISVCWSLALQERSRCVCRAHRLRKSCYSGVCFLNGLRNQLPSIRNSC